jgi:hypothetical protein
MSKPSKLQLQVLQGLSSNDQLTVMRDDTEMPARWYFAGKRLNYATARVLYCRGWIEQKARAGLHTLYRLSAVGREIIKQPKENE